MAESKNTMKSFEEKDGIKRKIYYHYTTLDALYSIVTSKTFRLTSLTSSNDETELTYPIDDFWQDLKSAYKKIDRLNDYPSKHIDEYNNEYEMMKKTKSYSFALSLSDKRDNLAHWDRYADRCKGVCIAFNVAGLSVYDRRKDLPQILYNLFITSGVLYKRTDRIKKIINSLNGYFFETENGKIDFISILEWKQYFSIYSALKCFVKNPCFMDEGEFRIYFDEERINDIVELVNLIYGQGTSSFGDNILVKFKNLLEEIKVEERKYDITPRGIRSYHNLCLSEIWGNGLIPEICLGPLCTQNTKELEQFLEDNGLKGCKVTKSKVPIN